MKGKIGEHIYVTIFLLNYQTYVSPSNLFEERFSRSSLERTFKSSLTYIFPNI